MKRLITLTLLILTFAIVAPAAGSGTGEIRWDSTEHDFGTIHASDGKVKAEYTFTNTSAEPVAVIAMTNGGCGCTVPEYPRKPIAAKNGKGTVSITFDPAKFKGEFRRQVQVTIQVGKKRVKTKLKFSGHIIP